MIVESRTGPVSTEGGGVVGLPVRAGADGPKLAVDGRRRREATGTDVEPDRAWCDRHGFTAKVGQVLTWPVPAPPGERQPPGGAPDPSTTAAAEVVLVGIGEDATGASALESLRRAVAAFVRANSHAGSAAFLLPDVAPGPADGATPSVAEQVAAVAEAGALAAYQYDAYRTREPSPRLDRLAIVAPSADGAEAEAALRRGARVAESVALARDLVNEPPSSLTPERFAAVMADRFSSVPGVSLEVWDEERIAAERLGGLLGVARGSARPPRLVQVRYRPPGEDRAESAAHLALVGKGITFDSGGLSLKTASGMETMKTDMSGAAAVLAALDAAAAFEAPMRITAIAPLTENMPGGSAIKPGDVLTTRSGKTIEVLNTDAEGRLVLADALTLAREGEPDAIVDLATLTGAQVVALGKEVAALFGTDDALLRDVQSAGERAGEPVWPLPLPDDYRSHIDSEVADMRNIGRSGQAGSIAAAFLLREFVGSVPWAHIDMAGPARADEATRYLSKGGTGFGVRTIVNLVTSEEVAARLARARAARAAGPVNAG